jgi:hypothetical protein
MTLDILTIYGGKILDTKELHQARREERDVCAGEQAIGYVEGDEKCSRGGHRERQSGRDPLRTRLAA